MVIMVFFWILILDSLRGIIGSRFYLLDESQRISTTGYGLLMYEGGTVCQFSSYWFNDMTADWLCRLMGHESLIKWEKRLKYSWQLDYHVAIHSIKCDGDVVPNCHSGKHYGNTCQNGHTEDIWLSCKIRQQKGDLTSFYLLDKNGQYTQNGHGLLMYQNGTVCDDQFNEEAADWVCRMMGFWGTSSWTNGAYSPIQDDNLPIALNDLKCVLLLGFIPRCTFKTTTSDCTHTEDVLVNCLSNPMCSAGSYWCSDLNQCSKCPATTVSKKGSMSLSECVLCPLTSSPISGGKACSCDKGHGWVWHTANNQGVCIPCPANSYKDYEHGICIRCPIEATSPPRSENCECPTGFSWDSETKGCVDCNHVDDGSCVKVCSVGKFWNTDLNMCQDCPLNTYSVQGNSDLVCLSCPDNSTSAVGSSQCICSGYTFFSSDLRECINCPGGMVCQEGALSYSHCLPCPFGSVPLSNGQGCSCKRGHGWFWTKDFAGSCRPCPATTYNNKDQGICGECPDEATSLPQSEDCLCPNGLKWTGSDCVDCNALGSYTTGLCRCLAGTFWNLESKICEKCPQNHHSDDNSLSCTKCLFGFRQNGDPRNSFTCTRCPDHHVGNGVDCVICPEGTIPSEDKVFCQEHDLPENSYVYDESKTKVSDLVNVVLLSIVTLGVVVILGIAVTVCLWVKRKKREEMFMTKLAITRTQQHLPFPEEIYTNI